VEFPFQSANVIFAAAIVVAFINNRAIESNTGCDNVDVLMSRVVVLDCDVL
jgi:hypothetical protein